MLRPVRISTLPVKDLRKNGNTTREFQVVKGAKKLGHRCCAIGKNAFFSFQSARSMMLKNVVGVIVTHASCTHHPLGRSLTFRLGALRLDAHRYCDAYWACLVCPSSITIDWCICSWLGSNECILSRYSNENNISLGQKRGQVAISLECSLRLLEMFVTDDSTRGQSSKHCLLY